MNKRQKLVQDAFLKDEERIISRLKTVYNKSLDDITKKSKELQDQINTLDALQQLTDDAEEKALLKSMEQAKIYQKQYQDALKKQIGSILDNMQVEEFKTVDEYLRQCYENGFIGTMYDLHGQGVPLCMPIDQEAMVRAVQTDSKISQGLYTRLGEDVALLKKKITAQVSRSISTGMTYAQMAQQLAAYTNIGFNNAVRIARTEGHRIQVQSTMDACYKAKDKGADVVKQWDATLDRRTRKSHTKVDGEIRELDEPFSNGLMFPGDPAGGASEVVNCRCALLQRAKWALDEDELKTLKERAKFFRLNKTKNFDEFKEKYLKASEVIMSLGDMMVTKKVTNEVTDADRKAIYDYMGANSYIVNDKLRTGAELTSDEAGFIMALDIALDKMPEYSSNLQRSLFFATDEAVDEFLKPYSIGETITYKEYISTTKGNVHNPEGQVQIYIQDAKHGKDISAFNSGEDEVLYKRNSTFKVINMVERDGKHYILMVEKDE